MKVTLMATMDSGEACSALVVLQAWLDGRKIERTDKRVARVKHVMAALREARRKAEA